MTAMLAFGGAAAGQSRVCQVPGVRPARGHDDRAFGVLFAWLKAEGPPRRLGRVPGWAWLPLWVPVVVAVHLLVLLPLFAGAHLAGRLAGRGPVERTPGG